METYVFALFCNFFIEKDTERADHEERPSSGLCSRERFHYNAASIVFFFIYRRSTDADCVLSATQGIYSLTFLYLPPS